MANPRREYRPDRLYPWEVQNGLATRFTGHWIEYYAELPSPNRRARELATGPASPPEGLLVLAEKQTAGRGRLGRSWFSPAGTGIWMTLLLKRSEERRVGKEWRCRGSPGRGNRGATRPVGGAG